MRIGCASTAPQLESVLACPECGHRSRETMPTDACIFHDCSACGAAEAAAGRPLAPKLQERGCC